MTINRVMLVLSIIGGIFFYPIFLLTPIFIYHVIKEANLLKRKEEWRLKYPHVKYQHYYGKTGIALDTTNRKIHLKEGKKEKAYDFNEIKSWRYNISYGGQSTGGGGLGAVGHDISVNMRNKKESGFFVSVRDVENPEWRLAFRYMSGRWQRKMEIELKKWMEIFDQCINNN